jgi:hypothetical protein
MTRSAKSIISTLVCVKLLPERAYDRITRNMRPQRLTVERLGADCIDVRKLNSARLFAGEAQRMRFGLQWPHLSGMIGYRYRLELRFGRETFPQNVRVSWTPCALGGERPWFHCPGCSRRIAKLYWGGEQLRYRCRQCLGNFLYASQTKSASGRRLYAAWKLRMRLGSYSVSDPVPKRPLGMHRRTYNRLRARLEALESRLSRCLRAKTPDYENLSYYVPQ